jgi:16S rRNA (guanine966-N2)-methyltransferase
MRIIAGRWRGRRIESPASRDTRPTADRVREAWMSAVQFDLPDANVVDLFAGSGALGLEALSRGAGHATFVELASRALKSLEKNIASLDARDETTIVRKEALSWAGTLEPGTFDIAFADPPYGHGVAARLAEIFSERGFATTLWVEHAAGEPMPELAGSRTRRYGDTALTSIPART